MKKILTLVLCISLTGSPVMAQSDSASAPEVLRIAFFDEIRNHTRLDYLNADADIFQKCPPTDANKSLAILIPVAVFVFKLFLGVVDTALKAREKKRIEQLSATNSALRTDPSFVFRADRKERCLIVVREGRDPAGRTVANAIYVLRLAPVGNSAFQIEPLTARVNSSSVWANEKPEELNASLSIAIQSVVPGSHGNQLVVLPSYSVTFEGLKKGASSEPAPGKEWPKSGVLPMFDAASPTTVAAALTEAHVHLNSEKERLVIEQANRAALIEALGSVLEKGLGG